MKKLIYILLLTATIGLLPIILRLSGLMGGNMSCDFISQILPLTIEAKKMLASGAPMWSWNSFMGDNFIGANNFYVLGTPFTLICCLFPYDYIAVGVIVCLLLQVVLYGVSSMAYLRRMGFNDELARLGALMYALSSFCIISVYYFSFAIGIILFPLILIGVEELLERKRYAESKLACIVAIAITCNFYFAAMSLLGASIYFIVRLLYSASKHKVCLFAKGVGSVILGILLSSIILIPTMLCTVGSERNVTGEVETGVIQIVIGALIKAVYIIIPRFSEGFVELYHPFANYALYIPFVSCVFVIAYIIRNKKSWLTALLLCYTAILLSPLNTLFSMGASAAYARWSYILLLMMIVASLYAIQSVNASAKTVRRIIIGLLASTLALGLLLRYKLGCFDNRTISSLALWEVVMFTTGMVALYYVANSKRIVTNMCIGVVLFGGFNMLIYSCLIVNRSEVCSVDNLISNKCDRQSDNVFRYRTDTSKEEHNIGYALNRAVPSQFHSVQNKAMSDFNRLYRSPKNPYITISHHRESFDALTSVKDIIVYDGENFPFIPKKVIEQKYGYTIYENDYYIPIGFAYDSFITEKNFGRQQGEIDYTTPEQNKDYGVGLLQTLVIPNEDASELGRYLTEKTAIDFNARLDSVVNLRRAHTAVNFEGNTTGFKSEIINRSDRPMVYFFSVPNDPGFTATLDNSQELKIYRANFGMMAVVVPPGPHSLNFHYLTPGLKSGAWLSLLGLIIAGGLFSAERMRNKRMKL